MGEVERGGGLGGVEVEEVGQEVVGEGGNRAVVVEAGDGRVVVVEIGGLLGGFTVGVLRGSIDR